MTGLRHKGRWHQVIGVSTDGSIEVQFQYMKRKPPFDEEHERRELLERLNDIIGIDIPTSTVTGRRPWFHLSVLQNEIQLDRFVKVLDWFVQEVKATEAA